MSFSSIIQSVNTARVILMIFLIDLAVEHCFSFPNISKPQRVFVEYFPISVTEVRFVSFVIRLIISVTIWVINLINRLIHSIKRLSNAVKYPIRAIQAIDRSVNASGGQLAAGGPQVDRPNYSSVPIKPLTDRLMSREGSLRPATRKFTD